MTDKTGVVTGACGEIGQALVQNLARRGGVRILTMDLAPLPDSLRGLPLEHLQGDLLMRARVLYDCDPDVIYHLAASLSSKAETAPEEAHRINVEATLQLLQLAAYKSEKSGRAVKFLFPSSIAAHSSPKKRSFVSSAAPFSPSFATRAPRAGSAMLVEKLMCAK